MHDEWLRILTAALGALAAWAGIARSNAKSRELEAAKALEEKTGAKEEATAARLHAEAAHRREAAANAEIAKLTEQLESERAVMLREVEIANDLRREAEVARAKAEERARQLAAELHDRMKAEMSGGRGAPARPRKDSGGGT